MFFVMILLQFEMFVYGVMCRPFLFCFVIVIGICNCYDLVRDVICSRCNDNMRKIKLSCIFAI